MLLMILIRNFNWRNVLKRHYLFLLIFFLALFLRSYRLEYLTTFGHDQGIDFARIREMIITHNLTLIGIKVSIADFYQGPLYLYLLLPLFIILKTNLLAGPLTGITISLSALLLLYLLLLKLGNQKAAIIGSLLFTVSPQFIQYANTPLYEHFAPPFYLTCLYFLYQATTIKNRIRKDKKILLAVFLTGLFAGMSMELHFLSTTLTLTALIYLSIKRSSKIKSILMFAAGLFLGLLPTITFEIKHSFLNTHYLISYLIHHSGQINLFDIKLNTWINGAGTFFGAENFFLGIFILALIIFILVIYKKPSSEGFNFIREIALILFLLNIIFALISPNMGWWYPLPFWVASLVLLALYFSYNLNNKIITGIIFFVIAANFFFSVSLLNNNHGYYMPPGWSLKKIDQAAEIIINDATEDRANFNIASLIESSRAYPLRYAVQIKGKEPGKITDYNQNNALYVIAGDSVNQVINSDVWEIKEFSPFKLGQSWNIEDNIFLYRLDRIRE